MIYLRETNMKKLLYFIIVLIILAGGYYFYAQKNKRAMAPTVENGGFLKEDAGIKPEEPSGEQATAPTSSAPLSSPFEPSQNSTETKGTFSGGEEGAGLAPDVLVVQVNFDGTEFTPASVDIKVGDIVIFKNNSSQDFWPASVPHPTHTDYPAFDAKQAVSPGGKFQFKFEKVGSWQYHNHLNPSAKGVVNVSTK